MTLRRPADQDIVVIGATGDLAARKLLPALYNLQIEGLLPERGDVIGVAPLDWDDGRFRAHAEEAVRSFSRSRLEPKRFAEFAARLRFVAIGPDGDLRPLRAAAERPERLLYLAVPASAFTSLAGDLSARGKSDEAVRYYLEALRFNPADAEAHYHLGLEWLQRGRTDEAMASLREAVRLKPDLADAHFQLATALVNRRAISEAISQYHETLRLDPESLPALNNLAWILATHPEAQFRNGPEAVQLAERACELTSYQQTVFVGTLAAACAEAGRFDDAVATAQKACALASERGEPGLLQKKP